MRFKGQVAVVAGASGGIGKQVAIELAAEGAQVIVWATNEERLVKAAEEITAKGGAVQWAQVDTTDFDNVQTAVNKVLEIHGRIDIMVSTVGGGTFKPLIDVTPEFFDREFEYNFKTVFNCFTTALKPMVAQQFGRLLCYISTTGGTPGLSAYGASKAACKALLESIAAEHAKDHITANGVLPGFVVTPWTNQAFDYPGGKERLEQTIAGQPLGANTVENVARTTLNILADDRCTGQIFALR